MLAVPAAASGAPSCTLTANGNYADITVNELGSVPKHSGYRVFVFDSAGNNEARSPTTPTYQDIFGPFAAGGPYRGEVWEFTNFGAHTQEFWTFTRWKLLATC